ncbi:hypothetical protein ES705_26024 [subsurface metagenome]
MSKEEKAKKWEEEIKDFNNWLGVVKTDDRSMNKGILLFNINKNLERIADSLDAIFAKM